MNNKLCAGLLAAVAVAGALVTTLAWAGGGRAGGGRSSGGHHHSNGGHYHHSHARVGVYVGAPFIWSPFWYPYYPYYYPYYYYPPAVVVRPDAPSFYVEQADPAAGAAPTGPSESAPAPQAQPQQLYWHYCPDSKTYYPYVNTCASQWQRVIPQIPPPG